jgi:hypothetical protein
MIFQSQTLRNFKELLLLCAAAKIFDNKERLVISWQQSANASGSPGTTKREVNAAEHTKF